MTDITKRRLDAIARLKQKPKLKKTLTILLENIVAETGEVAHPLYDNKGHWQFHFPYAFKELALDILQNMKKVFENKGLELHRFPNDYLYDENTLFYMTENEIETYFVMDKLVEGEQR